MSRQIGEVRHRPRKRFGQHFLAPAWAAKVVAAIAPQPDQTFLEIGPGQGVITRRLAEKAASVTAVEVDRDLAAELRRAAIDRLTVIDADILETDITSLGLPRSTRVAGNLPYNISSPILVLLLQAQQRASLFADATLMLQKEVADRLAAGPGTKDYGPLGIFTALQARVSRLLTLPPGAFHPPPKVMSAVVRLRLRADRERPAVAPTFEPMVRALFSARRKTVANGLKGPASAAGLAVADALEQAGIDGRLRPEQLTLEQLLALARALNR